MIYLFNLCIAITINVYTKYSITISLLLLVLVGLYMLYYIKVVFYTNYIYS